MTMRIFSAFLAFAATAAIANAQDTPPAPGQVQEVEIGFQNVLEGAREVLETVQAMPSPTEESTTTGEARILTVRETVQLALTQNPKAAQNEADVDAAIARIGQARSAYLPVLTGKVSYNYQEGAGSSFSQGFLTDLVASGAGDTKEITRRDSVGVQQVLYAGGQRKAALRASAYLAESQEWQRVSALQQLEFEAKQAYYDCLLAGALLRVARDSVVTFERHRSDAQQMFDVGMSSRFEVLRAETELGARESDVVEAANRRRLAYANLRRLLALPQDDTLVLETKLEWVPLDGAPAGLAQTAMTIRPEILALEKAIAAAEQDVRRVKGQYRPSVAAGAEWTNTDGAGSFVIDGWTASVGASFDFYAGGKRKYEKAEASARLVSLQRQLDDIKLLVELDVRQAFIRVEDAIAKIQREQGNVKLAQEGQRLAGLRFQEGVGTQADVLDAELALTNAETQLVVSLREYVVAHAALDKAMGKSWFDELTGFRLNLEPEAGPFAALK